MKPLQVTIVLIVAFGFGHCVNMTGKRPGKRGVNDVVYGNSGNPGAFKPGGFHNGFTGNQGFNAVAQYNNGRFTTGGFNGGTFGAKGFAGPNLADYSGSASNVKLTRPFSGGFGGNYESAGFGNGLDGYYSKGPSFSAAPNALAQPGQFSGTLPQQTHVPYSTFVQASRGYQQTPQQFNGPFKSPIQTHIPQHYQTIASQPYSTLPEQPDQQVNQEVSASSYSADGAQQIEGNYGSNQFGNGFGSGYESAAPTNIDGGYKSNLDNSFGNSYTAGASSSFGGGHNFGPGVSGGSGRDYRSLEGGRSGPQINHNGQHVYTSSLIPTH